MVQFTKGCKPPDDLADRIKLSNLRHGARLLSLPDVTLTSYDCRDKGLVTPIKSQASCGGCYAFAAICCSEGAAILGGLGTASTLNWSEQCVLDCGDVGGCDGGWPETVLAYVKSRGTANTSDYPFQGSVGRCKSSVPHTNVIKDYGYIGTSDAVPSVQSIKNAMFEHGPLAVAVAADNAFSNYQSGTVFKGSGSTEIDHAVGLVGWDDNGGYWIMRNHWTTQWGNAGYMNIAYDANLIGYGAMFAIAGSPPSPSLVNWSDI